MVDDIKDIDNMPMETRLKLSTLLPEYIQTRTNRNFFDATYETLFSENNSENVTGYIGEKPERLFDSEHDFYIPERTPDRQAYQLAPVINSGSGDTNVNVLYRDIINKLSYNGAYTKNHERLFRQDFYSFSPMIDLNMFVNFNQYFWLEKGPKTTEFFIDVESFNNTNNTITLNDNHGLTNNDIIMFTGNTPPEIETQKEYTVEVIDDITIKLNEVTFFSFVSISNAKMYYRTDLKSIEGKTTKNFRGTILKNGMVIRTYNDILPNINGKRFIIEGVGESIQLIDFDVLLGYDSSPYDTQPYDYDELSYIADPDNIDYVTIQRGSKNGNVWSMRNRWFHESLLNEQEVSGAFRASRPIIQYNRDIELYNFGKNYVDEVDVVYDSGDIQSDVGGSSLMSDGIEVTDGTKLLIINDVDDTKNNRIFEVYGKSLNNISLFEIQALDIDDVVFVNDGQNYGGFNYYIDLNENLQSAQTRQSSTQNILFNLYDYNGISLDDETSYNKSNFSGSKLFSYKIDEDEKTDSVLQIKAAKNSRGEFVFENNLDKDRYTFELDFVETEIEGSYYFKNDGELKSHWHKNDIEVNQGIIDEFISDGETRIYELSQKPALKSDIQPITIVVKLNGVLLENGVDYQVSDSDGVAVAKTDKYIRLSDTLNISEGDFIKIVTYNSDTPEGDFSGYYEVPSLVGLTSNTDNKDVIDISRNDVFEHFFSILERQNEFIGDPIGLNNSWNINVNYGRGNKIVQNVAPITKFAILNKNKETDIYESINYVEREYRRFSNMLRQKLEELYLGDFNNSTPYEEWLNTAISDINLGKSSEFPFYNSGMASFDHIPPSPQYLGIMHIHRPKIYLEKSLVTPTYVLIKHDGSFSAAREQTYSYEDFALNGSSNVIQLSQEVNFGWEVMVFVNDIQLEHNADYTISNNTIEFNASYTGQVRVEYITNIIDLVTLFYENKIFSRSDFRDLNPYLEIQSIIPGAYRKTSYSKDEYNNILERSFNKWCSQRGFNYIENSTFDPTDEKTYNYSGLVTSTGDILKGSWRAIFEHYYDTDTPDTTPWKILGFNEKPYWWDSEYGKAPYTSANIKMWDDIENGVIKLGPRKGEYKFLKRENMFIPVDNSGNLKSIPDIFGTQQPSITLAKRDWDFGDIGPVEYQWRKSLHYSFGLLKTLFLMKPNMITEIFWEPENNMVVAEGKQFVNSQTLKRYRSSQLVAHNTIVEDERIRKFGIQQFISSYLRSFGKGSHELQKIVNNINVNLGYGVGGFIDKTSFTAATDNFGLIPQENIDVTLHESSSIKQVVASGIILTRVEGGYIISGYDEDTRKVPYYKPIQASQEGTINVGGTKPTIYEWQPNVRYSTGTYIKINNRIFRSVSDHRSSSNFSFDNDKWSSVSATPVIGGITVRTYSEFEDTLSYVRYDEVIDDVQIIYDMFVGYQRYLEEHGVIFNIVDQDTNQQIFDFKKMFRDVLNFINTTPEINETIAVSPFSEIFKIKSDGHMENLYDFVRGNSTIVSGNGITISPSDILVSREDDITITTDRNKTAEKIFKVEISFTEKEHLVIFDNTTNFNDIIFEDLTNIRQPRISVFMYRTKDWDGKMKSSGFFIDDGDIRSNLETSTSKIRKYYDPDSFLIGENLSGISKNAFGYQNKEYYRNFLFDQRDSFNFYLGQLQEKGTNRGISKILRNDFVRRISNIELNELWAIRTGQYGNLNAYTNIDFRYKLSDIKTNPQIIQFKDSGTDDPRNTIIELSPDDDRFLTIRDSNVGQNQFEIKNKIEYKMPCAGFLKLDEAKYKVPFINQEYIFDDIKEYDRIWIAENTKKDWEVLRIVNSGETLNGIETNGDYNVSDSSVFSEGDTIIIDVDGLRKLLTVTTIVDSTHITINDDITVSIDDPVTIFKTDIVSFDTLGDFQNYTPFKSWDEDVDKVFIKDNKEVINPVTLEVIRKVENQVSLDNIANARIYETVRNTTLAELNIHHPLQGLISYDANINIDFITTHDPAKYNSDENITKKKIWAKDFVGKIWWNLNKVRYLDYDQGGFTYKTNNWGGIFPGTSIEICQWIRSEFHPNDWEKFMETPSGKQSFGINVMPLDVTKFVKKREYNPLRGSFIDYYYFWVKDDSIRKSSKTLSTKEIKDIISNPSKAGIRWISPISNDALIIANTQDVISDVSATQIVYSNDKDTTQHSEWYLFGEKTTNKEAPSYIFDKVKHSLVGYNEVIGTQKELNDNGISNDMITNYGEIIDDGNKYSVKLPVPDTNLISRPLYGSMMRPRQSWFRDKVMGREAFIASVNTLFKEINWVDSNTNWEDVMFEQDEQPSSSNYDYIVDTLFDRDNLIDDVGFITGSKVLVENDISKNGKWSLWEFNGSTFDLISSQGFRLSDYWNFDDYYAEGFDEDVQVLKTYPTAVERNLDLGNLDDGDIVKILDDGNNKFIINQVKTNDLGEKSFSLVAKEDATFKFDRFICVCPFSEQAMQSLFEGFINVLSTSRSRNRMLIDMIKEAYRQNPIVDWAFQTSLVELLGIEEQLVQSSVNVKDLSENIVDYFNDIKPLHVKPLALTESKFTAFDNSNVFITDENQKDIEIVVDRVSCVADMTLDESMWTEAERIQSTGKTPEDYIPGCKFRGSEFDSKFFNFFENVVGAGYDVNSYDSTILGYDFDFDDIQTLYDVTINGKTFTDPDDDSVVVNGGSFYQPLLSENRPPENVTLRVGDSMMFDVYTFPVNIDFSFGYDAQPYDAEVDLNGNPVGYDYTSENSFEFILRPKMIQDLYVGDSIKNKFDISQIPQSNDAIFVYVDGILVKYSDDYEVDWTAGRKPKILFNSPPNNNQYIKILTFSIGGNSSVVNDKLFDNNSGTVFEMDTIIEPSYTVKAFVNGEERQASFDSSLTETQVKVSSAGNGDTVYIVVYQGDDFTEISNEKFVYQNEALTTKVSGPNNIKETQTMVYKNGKRLVPSYTRYFDPITPVQNLYINEDIYFSDGISVYIDKVQTNDFVYDIRENVVVLDTPQENVEILVMNDVSAEYHYEDNELYIHTVAYGTNVVSSIPDGSRLFVNNNFVEFSRPDNEPTPVNDFNIVSKTYQQPSTAIQLNINGVDFDVDVSDTINDVINTINNLDVDVNSYKDDNDRMYIRDVNNKDIDLEGPWEEIGFDHGSYQTAQSQIQEAIGESFRVSLPDGKMKIISRNGEELTLTPSGSVDIVSVFGFSSLYGNNFAEINVISLDDNEGSRVRTEVYQGSTTGQYPITRNGFSEYSTKVSVIGFDKINFSDYELKTIDLGYDTNGYGIEYDYNQSPGIDFEIPHNENETVIVTTFNGAEKEIKSAFRILQTLNNTTELYTLSEDTQSIVKEDITQNAEYISVEDDTYLPIPDPTSNTPAFVSIGGEIIGYFEIDKSDPSTPKLKNLIRGAKGSVFGYFNGSSNVIKAGSVIENMSDNKFMLKDSTQKVFV